jgi:hypothetical protein
VSFDIIKNAKQISDMIHYQKNKAFQNRELIIEALLDLQKATPIQIENYFQKKYPDKMPMVLITIKRILKRLELEKLVTNNKGTYKLSFRHSKSTLSLYLPEIFGNSLIMSVGQFYLESIEQSFNNLLIRLGSIIIFTFIEVAYLQKKVNDASISEEFFYLWLREAIPIESMWERFVTIYGEKQEEIRSSKSINNLNKINIKMLKKLENIFRKQYSEIYEQLQKSFSDSINNLNKDRSVNERDQLRDYKQVRKLLKKGYDGRDRIVLEPNKLQNKVYGSISSHNWAKEVKELEDINND